MASPQVLENAKICEANVKANCKKWSSEHGDINTPIGRKGCKSKQRSAGVWGEDKSPACQEDPEDATKCNHTGCAYLENHTRDTYAGVIDTHMNSLPSDPKPLTMKDRMKDRALTMRDKASGMASRFGFGSKTRSMGGKKKSKKRTKKSRKSKKSKKSKSKRRNKKSKRTRRK